MDSAWFQNCILTDRYALYEELHKDGGIHKVNNQNIWVVSNYNTVLGLLKENRLSSNKREKFFSQFAGRRKMGVLESFYSDWLMYMDNPRHSRIRKKTISSLSSSSHIGSLCLGEYGNLRPKKTGATIDVKEDLAEPFLAQVMPQYFGMKDDLYQKIIEYSVDILNFFHRASTQPSGADEKAVAAINRIYDLLGGLECSDKFEDGSIAKKIVDSNYGGENTSLNVLISLIVDTWEPIIAAIQSAIYWSMKVENMVRHDVEFLDRYIDEVLRMESPFQTCNRIAREDIAIDTLRIEKGAFVMLLIGAANRDPSVFKNPNVFESNRRGVKSLHFGYGVHSCIGGFLAKKILHEFFRTHRDFLSELRPKSLVSAKWLPAIGFRSLSEFYLRASGAGGAQ